MGELGPTMNTESDRSSENRYEEPLAAEESQRADTSGGVWPDGVVPPWSVPPSLIAPQTAQPEAEVTPTDAERADDNSDWPGAAPLAG